MANALTNCTNKNKSNGVITTANFKHGSIKDKQPMRPTNKTCKYPPISQAISDFSCLTGFFHEKCRFPTPKCNTRMSLTIIYSVSD